jgi:hypothetical protein
MKRKYDQAVAVSSLLSTVSFHDHPLPLMPSKGAAQTGEAAVMYVAIAAAGDEPERASPETACPPVRFQATPVRAIARE